MRIDLTAQESFDLGEVFDQLAQRAKRNAKIYPGNYEFRQYIEAHGSIIHEVVTQTLGVHGTVRDVVVSLAITDDRETELEIASGISNDLASLGISTSIFLPPTVAEHIAVHIYL